MHLISRVSKFTYCDLRTFLSPHKNVVFSLIQKSPFRGQCRTGVSEVLRIEDQTTLSIRSLKKEGRTKEVMYPEAHRKREKEDKKKGPEDRKMREKRRL